MTLPHGSLVNFMVFSVCLHTINEIRVLVSSDKQVLTWDGDDVRKISQRWEQWFRPRWCDLYNVQPSLKLKVEGWTEDVSNSERIQDDINHIPHTKSLTVQHRPLPNDNPRKRERKRERRTNAVRKRGDQGKSQLEKYCISQEGKLIW